MNSPRPRFTLLIWFKPRYLQGELKRKWEQNGCPKAVPAMTYHSRDNPTEADGLDGLKKLAEKYRKKGLWDNAEVYDNTRLGRNGIPKRILKFYEDGNIWEADF